MLTNYHYLFNYSDTKIGYVGVQTRCTDKGYLTVIEYYRDKHSDGDTYVLPNFSLLSISRVNDILLMEGAQDEFAPICTSRYAFNPLLGLIHLSSKFLDVSALEDTNVEVCKELSRLETMNVAAKYYKENK